ncbi:MAG: permease [Cocleimonas sp.]|nr:permease [Cocleimonas sp.]
MPKEIITLSSSQRLTAWLISLPILLVAWFYLYSQLDNIANFILSLTPYDRSSHLGESIHFFLYDTPKILLLLAGIVFLMGIIQTFFSPEKTRAILSGRRLGVGNTMAALLGIVTPFCSCSAVPLFVGFLSAGVPLGITFSFLISAPMINEIALGLLFGLFGWKVAVLYLVLGLSIAIGAGLIIGKLGMEKYLQDWVRDIHTGAAAPVEDKAVTWEQRFQAGWSHVKEIVGKVWVYVLIGIAVGALIHGFVPEDFMASIMGKEAWWSVPAAVLMGIPMYSSAAGILPVVEALMGKGAALGTTLAFMMSVIALSLPEILILRKVLKTQLILTFVGIVAMGILMVGYLFNILL